MREGTVLVYLGPSRCAVRRGGDVARVEIEDGKVAWAEARRSGTGGPLSGSLLARWDGAWAEGADPEGIELACEAAGAAGLELPVSPPEARRS